MNNLYFNKNIAHHHYFITSGHDTSLYKFVNYVLLFLEYSFHLTSKPLQAKSGDFPVREYKIAHRFESWIHSIQSSPYILHQTSQ